MARTGHSFPPQNDQIRRSGRAVSASLHSGHDTHFTRTRHALTRVTSRHANALADRLEQGARALIAFATGLTDAEWRTRVPHDGRTVGVIVHHVASVYPIEIQLAQTIADGKPVTGVTMDDMHAMNAKHAAEHAAVTKAGGARSASHATATPRRRPSARSATNSSRRRRRCRSTPTLRSRASSCSRITPSGTAITTSPRIRTGRAAVRPRERIES